MPHRKQIEHFHEPGHLHEFTFSRYKQRPLLSNDDWREKLARSLDNAGREEQFDLVDFVLMPEHVHLLVYPKVQEPPIGRYLARVKQPFSKQIKEMLVEQHSPLLAELTVQERPGKTCFRFWQEGPGFDRNIFSIEAIQAAIDYIHMNPVRRNLCEKATDWRWSSARYYLCDGEPKQHAELPYIHGLPGLALD
jgi:REP-associated tyrosine transposase